VTALKEGFRPVQRVVQIEQSDKSKKVRERKNRNYCSILL
jgi:hypothetical protein